MQGLSVCCGFYFDYCGIVTFFSLFLLANFCSDHVVWTVQWTGVAGTGQVFGRLTLDGPTAVAWRLSPLPGFARASREHFLGDVDGLGVGQAMEEG